MSDEFTSLSNKHFSPLLLRKYTHWGPVIYVAVITDDDVSNLDSIVLRFMDGKNLSNLGLQGLRNLAGGLTDELVNSYGRSEGVAVVIAADKAIVSSLHGDFMTHAMCRQELYSLLNLSTGV